MKMNVLNHDKKMRMVCLGIMSYATGFILIMFAASAGLVYFAGVCITRYADALACITGTGGAAIGLVSQCISPINSLCTS